MMNTINIHNLSQENVSCLNTALIILMLSNRHKNLPKYLKAIRIKSNEMMLSSDLNHINEEQNNIIFNRPSSLVPLNSTTYHASSSSSSSSSSTSNSNATHPFDLISNFRDLLIFWQNHYLQKDKDCSGLEQNSKIDFAYWRTTVDLLLDPNCNNNCSLNFYLKNEFNCNKKSIDEFRPD